MDMLSICTLAEVDTPTTMLGNACSQPCMIIFRGHTMQAQRRSRCRRCCQTSALRLRRAPSRRLTWM